MSKTEAQSEALRLADELMEPTLWPTDIRNLGAATLRRLDAENKALRERLEIDPSHPIDGIEARDETIQQLEAQINGLRADAERYHHLRDCNSGSLVVMQITGTGEDDWHVLTEGDADEAIDAAMAAAKNGGAA